MFESHNLRPSVTDHKMGQVSVLVSSHMSDFVAVPQPLFICSMRIDTVCRRRAFLLHINSYKCPFRNIAEPLDFKKENIVERGEEFSQISL